jgi:beta-phosphoglucomutase-like phosphatase (HAD superfamily)
MSSRTYDAVVFDLDGTLIDTENLCNAAGVAACHTLGLSVGMEFFESLAGIHDDERVRLISAHVGADLDRLAFFGEWDRQCGILFADGIPLKPGAADLVALIAEMGLPLGLATSSRREPAHEKLRLAGLGSWFKSVVTFDDVAAAKPAPDPYLVSAARLNADPARCLAFEDSETGARSAHAAGMTVVQVPDIHAASGLHAHHVAATLMEGARAAGLLPG